MALEQELTKQLLASYFEQTACIFLSIEMDPVSSGFLINWKLIFGLVLGGGGVSWWKKLMK